jgi:hypothetical protein
LIRQSLSRYERGMKATLLACVLSVLAFACASSGPSSPGPATPQDPRVISRGEALRGAPAIALTALLATPEAHDGQTVQLEGPVRKACTKKGCWMELAPEEQAQGVRITFKDYGFFVPLDSAGATAKVEGTVKVAELSEEMAEHYVEEGATVSRGPDGKAREVQLVATGVELRR